MTLDINKIKAAALAATQGEWKIGVLESYHGYNGQPCRFFYRNENDNHHTRCCVNGGEGDNGETFDSDADALFITTANPAAVLELIERLENAERCLFQMQNAAIDLSKKLEASEQRTDEFVTRFSRYVGGDGYFWLHDLHDFYDDWKLAAMKESE